MVIWKDTGPPLMPAGIIFIFYVVISWAAFPYFFFFEAISHKV